MSLLQKNLKRFQGQSFLEILRVAAYFDTSFDMIHKKNEKESLFNDLHSSQKEPRTLPQLIAIDCGR